MPIETRAHLRLAIKPTQLIRLCKKLHLRYNEMYRRQLSPALNGSELLRLHRALSRPRRSSLAANQPRIQRRNLNQKQSTPGNEVDPQQLGSAPARSGALKINCQILWRSGQGKSRTRIRKRSQKQSQSVHVHWRPWQEAFCRSEALSISQNLPWRSSQAVHHTNKQRGSGKRSKSDPMCRRQLNLVLCCSRTLNLKRDVLWRPNEAGS